MVPSVLWGAGVSGSGSADVSQQETQPPPFPLPATPIRAIFQALVIVFIARKFSHFGINFQNLVDVHLKFLPSKYIANCLGFYREKIALTFSLLFFKAAKLK